MEPSSRTTQRLGTRAPTEDHLHCPGSGMHRSPQGDLVEGWIVPSPATRVMKPQASLSKLVDETRSLLAIALEAPLGTRPVATKPVRSETCLFDVSTVRENRCSFLRTDESTSESPANREASQRSPLHGSGRTAPADGFSVAPDQHHRSNVCTAEPSSAVTSVSPRRLQPQTDKVASHPNGSPKESVNARDADSASLSDRSKARTVPSSHSKPSSKPTSQVGDKAGSGRPRPSGKVHATWGS